MVEERNPTSACAKATPGDRLPRLHPKNQLLARELNTPDKLRSHPDMIRFLRWIRKQDVDKRVRVSRVRS